MAIAEQHDIGRALRGVRWPHPSLVGSHEDGCTEGYIAQIVSSLLVASAARTVLETGSFMGTTAAWLALTLNDMGGGTLHVAEIDQVRADTVRDRLRYLPLGPAVETHVHCDDVFNVIRSLDNESVGLAFVDDDHTKPHVAAEIEALWPKMAPGGIITFHDVFGSVDLQEVVRRYGGYALNFPRLGPAGGIGVIQVE